MKTITLFCAAGMSTSLLVNKMTQAAKQLGYDCSIAAYGMNALKEKGPSSDIILLGPQVRFRLEEVKSVCPNVPVEPIDMRDYGMMNGEKVLRHAMTVLGEA